MVNLEVNRPLTYRDLLLELNLVKIQTLRGYLRYLVSGCFLEPICEAIYILGAGDTFKAGISTHGVLFEPLVLVLMAGVRSCPWLLANHADTSLLHELDRTRIFEAITHGYIGGFTYIELTTWQCHVFIHRLRQIIPGLVLALVIKQAIAVPPFVSGFFSLNFIKSHLPINLRLNDIRIGSFIST